MNLPERFDLTYIDNRGEKVRPVMLHRVIFGSIERFIGIITEHFAGAFPMWLTPVQINILPVKNEIHENHCNKIKELFESNGLRVQLDNREEKLGYRMRESQIKKIPYTIVVGDKELESTQITYRKYGVEAPVTVELNEFVEMVKKEVANKELLVSK